MRERQGQGTTRKLQERDGSAVTLELPSLEIVATSGDLEGRTWSFTLDTIRIGTAPDNDLVLEDDAVSRLHVRLTKKDDGVLVTDQGSTNGTYVGGVRVREAYLGPGIELRIGQSTLEVRQESRKLFALPGKETSLGPLLGGGAAMRRVYALLRAVAKTPATILVTGESGTGKEVTARLVHELSGRNGAMVVFDAAATSRDLIRSELFGHEKGAFTGAASARLGAIRGAHGGTLFLDEIGELPLELQPNLLRCLETREVTPVGSDTRHAVDTRLVAATHRNLSDSVAAGTFREDLFHRLSVIEVRMPPLRERPDDIPMLVEHFIASLGLSCRFSAEALETMQDHPWPGNVRALRNAVERMGLLQAGKTIGPEDLDLPGHSPGAPARRDEPATLDDLERRAILDALKATNGHQARAAEKLGIGLTTLKRKLREYRSRSGPKS